jgi:HPt (histidine-containing phosphotransfer) domain-containing protein
MSHSMELPVLDEHMWIELKDIMEDDFGLLLETFLNDAVARLVSIDDAIFVTDVSALREAAHSLKGSCGNIGAVRLSSLASNLEQQTRLIDWTLARTSFTEMQAEYAQLQKLIQQELPS